MQKHDIAKARELLALRLANAKKPVKASKAKTVKGQRNAAARAVKSTARFETQVLANSWSTPATFSTWTRYEWDTQFQTFNAALDAGAADAVVGYKRYVHNHFQLPLTYGEGSSFEKIQRREEWLERQGKHDLGLLGYSAIDRVQLASWHAFVRTIERWLTQTGMPESIADAIGKSLRDFRSDDELREDAQLGSDSRYAYGADGRLRRMQQTKQVEDARKFLKARRLLAKLPVSQYMESFAPSTGATYREVKAVMYEGLRAFRNTLEGLTPEGYFNDAQQYDASEDAPTYKVGGGVTVEAQQRDDQRWSTTPLAPSAEDIFISTNYDEVALTRTMTVKALQRKAEMGELLPAEIESALFLELLVDGTPIIDIRQVFDGKSERAFAQLHRDAALLVSTI
jgi:hypothetical protein